MATSTDSKSFQLDIVSPDRKVFSGEAEFCVFPGAEGELGILPRHAPLLSQLVAGEMKVVSKGAAVYYAVSGGFLEVKENKVTAAVEICEAAADIDQAKAQTDEKTAQAEVASKTDKAELLIAKQTIQFAKARLKVAARAPDQSKH
jgi:F-type H+-transporting ATPase subunit epsilon